MDFDNEYKFQLWQTHFTMTGLQSHAKVIWDILAFR